MFDSNFIPPGGFPVPFLMFMLAIPTIAILGMTAILRARKGTKKVLRRGWDAFPARILGATVTAKRVGTSKTMSKEPFLALHIEYFADGQTRKFTEPSIHNMTLVNKVRNQFVDYVRSSSMSHPPNGVMPLNISDPARKIRAERAIAQGGVYEMTLEEPFPITVFKKGSQIDWQVV